MNRIDKKQAVFEQLTLSDFKKWNPTALKTFRNDTIMMIKIKYFKCGIFISVAYF